MSRLRRSRRCRRRPRPSRRSLRRPIRPTKHPDETDTAESTVRCRRSRYVGDPRGVRPSRCCSCPVLVGSLVVLGDRSAGDDAAADRPRCPPIGSRCMGVGHRRAGRRRPRHRPLGDRRRDRPPRDPVGRDARRELQRLAALSSAATYGTPSIRISWRRMPPGASAPSRPPWRRPAPVAAAPVAAEPAIAASGHAHPSPADRDTARRERFVHDRVRGRSPGFSGTRLQERRRRCVARHRNDGHRGERRERLAVADPIGHDERSRDVGAKRERQSAASNTTSLGSVRSTTWSRSPSASATSRSSSRDSPTVTATV